MYPGTWKIQDLNMGVLVECLQITALKTCCFGVLPFLPIKILALGYQDGPPKKKYQSKSLEVQPPFFDH